MEESRGSASSPATGMAVENTIEELYISIFGVDGPQHDSEARSEHRIPKAPAKFREYEKDEKYFDPRVVSLGTYHHGEDHVTLSQMEESRGIASSPATGMADEHEEITQEAVTNPSEESFISILDRPQPVPKPRSKHRIPKAPAKFREYEKDEKYFDPQVLSLGPYHYDDEDDHLMPMEKYEKYFDPQVVSLGPYHHGEGHLEPMEKHKITIAKQFFDQFTNVTGGRGGIYKKFKELTGDLDLKECYDGVANMNDDVFARMMFLDGCFVLHFIENINYEEGKTKLEISKDLIPLIIRDIFLIDNQLPFEVLDVLMNLRWDSSSTGKENILNFIKGKVFIPMEFLPEKYSRVRHHDSFEAVDQRLFHGSLHLLDILRNILLDFTPSNGDSDPRKQSNKPGYFGSVMELMEIGIKFEKRNMKSLMDISYKENILFPQLLLPTMVINDTTISQLLNLTAFEADIYSGCGVTSFIHFLDTLINDDADVKMLRSKGILHHSLGSDDEVARLFNTWPADVTNSLQLFSYISMQIRQHRNRRVKISIATWVDKYFGSPWTAISFVAAVLLLVFTAIQTYWATFPRR